MTDVDEALARAASRHEKRKIQQSPGTWLPGADELDRDGSDDRDRVEDRDEVADFAEARPTHGNPQISFRLRDPFYSRLAQAAALYGVRPTTLARMMVVRGVNAILDAELARRARLLRDE
jgi:hypothetical protein